jgi:hypothetical protein
MRPGHREAATSCWRGVGPKHSVKIAVGCWLCTCTWLRRCVGDEEVGRDQGGEIRGKAGEIRGDILHCVSVFPCPTPDQNCQVHIVAPPLHASTIDHAKSPVQSSPVAVAWRAGWGPSCSNSIWYVLGSPCAPRYRGPCGRPRNGFPWLPPWRGEGPRFSTLFPPLAPFGSAGGLRGLSYGTHTQPRELRCLDASFCPTKTAIPSLLGSGESHLARCHVSHDPRDSS